MSSFAKQNVVTDSRMEVFHDGSTILVISTFLDGKCQGITMYTRVRRSSKTQCEARERLLECETSNPMASEVKTAM